MGLLVVTLLSALTCGQAASLPPGECSVEDSRVWEANNIIEADEDWTDCLNRRKKMLADGGYNSVECDQFDPNDPRTMLVPK